MDLSTRWPKDIKAVLQPGEWLEGEEIHRRVVDYRIEQNRWGPVAWLLSCYSLETARAFYHFITIDRTWWYLGDLTHDTKELNARLSPKADEEEMLQTGITVYEYTLGVGTSKRPISSEIVYPDGSNLTFA